MRENSPLRLILLVGALVVAPALLTAQQVDPTDAPAEESSAEGFFESIDVTVVNVDVYVTDKKGQRVRGLAREDFEILEDGKPMAITNFYAVDEGKPAQPVEAKSQPLPTPVPPPVGLAEIETPEDQRLHLVVYIDNYNLRPFNRNRVFGSLREFLRSRLNPGDRVMLVTYDRELHVRRPFTRDPQVIAQALFELEKVSAMGTQFDSDRRRVLTEIEDSRDAITAASRVRSFADEQFNDLEFTLGALKNTVSSLAGLPGRKAILYVSDGLPMVVAQDLYQAVQDKYSDSSGLALEALRYDASRKFQELASQANANRISFYTIDAGGLRVSSAVSAENRTASSSGLVESIYVSNIQSTLQFMADATGGKAIFNTNDPGKGLDIVAQDFSSYYSLGYSPAHSGDGRYHKIDVKTKRKDLVVRHREGYRDKTVEARMSDGVVSALFHDTESNALGIVVQRGKESRRDDGYFLVPIDVRIPIGNLTLVPHEGGRQARVRVFFAAQDSDGGMSEVQEARVPIEIPEADVARAVGQSYVYSFTLLMRQGPQRLAVGVRDEVGSAASFTVRTLRVGGG